MGLWSTSQFWECNHQRSSLLKINNKYWEKCEGTFHCLKRFPQETHNDSHLRYWRKSMQAVSKNLLVWRKTGKGKKLLERKSLVHKQVGFWITMTPKTLKKTMKPCFSTQTGWVFAFYGSNHICLMPDGNLRGFRGKVTWPSIGMSHFWTVWSESFGRPQGHRNHFSYISKPRPVI